ncbi:SOS response-associated peptidase [Microbacteriaceae bacterium VKM Ac-2854]|nr:SOS response-associated peptidase [Microbacteriaceae bacterium VKM Ac-2854]
MCGRFVLSDTTTRILPELLAGLEAPEPSYNVAPTDPIPAERLRHGERSMPLVRWGFVPGYAKDFEKQRPQPINARMETVATSGMFRKAFASARCIIPAAGYYEWTVTETGKQPHFIHDPDAGLAMAGIVSAWRDHSKSDEDPDRWRLSAAIITRDAHVAPGEVHDRMPACLTPDAYEDWLGEHLDTSQLQRLLERESEQVAHDLVHYEVNRAVNSVRNNGPQLIEPLA